MDHKLQLSEHIAHLAAQFINLQSNRTSLITVTRAHITDKQTVCTIFVSVLPEKEEPAAYIFLQRMAGPLKQYIMQKGGIHRVPHIAFQIDMGEKNRARIDEISNQIHTQKFIDERITLKNGVKKSVSKTIKKVSKKTTKKSK